MPAATAQRVSLPRENWISTTSNFDVFLWTRFIRRSGLSRFTKPIDNRPTISPSVPDLFNAKWLQPERSLCSTLIRSILTTEKGYKGTGNLLLELINEKGLCFLVRFLKVRSLMAVQFKIGRYMACWSDGKLLDYLLSVLFYGWLRNRLNKSTSSWIRKRKEVVFILSIRTSLQTGTTILSWTGLADSNIS